MSGDDRSFLDREKKSFAELDRMRREGGGRGGPRPQGKAARERSAAETKESLREADRLFAGGKRGEARKLAEAARDALGTPALAEACRAYHTTAGPPAEASLISCFLDAGERDVVLLGLAGLASARSGASFETTGSLRSQLRMLAEDADDEIAEAAEDLLADG